MKKWACIYLLSAIQSWWRWFWDVWLRQSCCCGLALNQKQLKEYRSNEAKLEPDLLKRPWRVKHTKTAAAALPEAAAADRQTNAHYIHCFRDDNNSKNVSLEFCKARYFRTTTVRRRFGDATSEALFISSAQKATTHHHTIQNRTHSLDLVTTKKTTSNVDVAELQRLYTLIREFWNQKNSGDLMKSKFAK